MTAMRALVPSRRKVVPVVRVVTEASESLRSVTSLQQGGGFAPRLSDRMFKGNFKTARLVQLALLSTRNAHVDRGRRRPDRPGRIRTAQITRF
jgi:hypothetical protein